MFLVIFLQILSSVAFIIFKKTMPYGPPFFLVGIRLLFSGIILLMLEFFLRRNKFSSLKGNWRLIIAASIFNIYITNAFEFWAMTCITAAKASFIYNFSPFISALLGYIFLHEKMTHRKWLGLAIGLFGLVPILLTPTSLCEQATVTTGFLSSGEIALLIAAIATSYGWISIKQLVYQKHVPIILANGISTLIGGLITLTQSGFTETWPTLNNKYLWIYTAAAVIVSQLMAYNLYAYLLEKYSATFLTFAGFIMPFFTAILGWLFLNEEVTLTFYISSLIVFIGLCVFYLEEKNSNPQIKN